VNDLGYFSGNAVRDGADCAALKAWDILKMPLCGGERRYMLDKAIAGLCDVDVIVGEAPDRRGPRFAPGKVIVRRDFDFGEIVTELTVYDLKYNPCDDIEESMNVQDQLEEKRNARDRLDAEIAQLEQDAAFPLPEGWAWGRCLGGTPAAEKGGWSVYVTPIGYLSCSAFPNLSKPAPVDVARAVIARHDAESAPVREVFDVAGMNCAAIARLGLRVGDVVEIEVEGFRVTRTTVSRIGSSGHVEVDPTYCDAESDSQWLLSGMPEYGVTKITVIERAKS
jgi:hypothetical protein